MSDSISGKNLEVLTFIAACPKATAKTEALRIMFADDLIDDRLEWLENTGLVEVLDDIRYSDGDIIMPIHNIVGYRLTTKGREALDLASDKIRRCASHEQNEARKEQLQNEHWSKDAKRSWVQWTISAILSIAAFFSGAVVEMLTGLMERIWSTIHEIVSLLF